MGEGFGCDRCWPASAESAWSARSSLAHVAELVDESHFHVLILACAACSQSFLSVFTESIDWVDGDDPQYWTVLPLTREEVHELAHRGEHVDERKLDALGHGRRSLWRDCPKGEPQRIYWSTGMSAGCHD